MDVASKIKEIISEQLNQDADGIDNSAHFVNDLGADSLDVVELVMALEEAFDLEIPDEDAEKIRPFRMRSTTSRRSSPKR